MSATRSFFHVIIATDPKTGQHNPCFQVISGALHISDHLSYLGVEYTQAYLQCLIGEKEGGEEDESPPASVLPAIPAATTTALIA